MTRASTSRALRVRVGALVVLCVAAAAVAATLPPIPQDLAYHDFADQRPLGAMPNALNVLSNIPFVIVGGVALAWLSGARDEAPWDRAVGAVLFAGVAATGVGSAWYHLAPDNARLVWDRLPMTVVFMTLLALAIADRLSACAGRALLPPLLVAGVGSVAYWALVDDLRPYGLVQFFPMLAIPYLMLAFPSPRGRDVDLWWAVGCYAVAKLTEHLDAPIFALGGIVSGHTLKHLLAGAASALVLGWIVRRPPR